VTPPSSTATMTATSSPSRFSSTENILYAVGASSLRPRRESAWFVLAPVRAARTAERRERFKGRSAGTRCGAAGVWLACGPVESRVGGRARPGRLPLYLLLMSVPQLVELVPELTQAVGEPGGRCVIGCVTTDADQPPVLVVEDVPT
jgi:hypothetical protein